MSTNFQTQTLRLKGGEHIQLRKTTDRYVCPVCGELLGGDPPYAESRLVIDGVPTGETSAVGSFEIYPLCHTQFGYTDYPAENEPQSIDWKWKQLRHGWLRAVEITEVIQNNLRNLGIDPEGEICSARGARE